MAKGPGPGATGDDGTPEGAGTNGPSLALPLTITHQYVKDLSFENPAAPEVFVNRQGAPNVSIEVNVGAQRLGETAFEVVLHLEAKAEGEDKTFFVAELDYAGVVQLGQVEQEHIQPLILIEVPRLLFPFARAIMSEVTRDGGFPPLMIGPIDFVEMYRQGLASQQQAREQGSAE